ncbi:MAG: GNAT family N-acetyltransferase [Myxococcales bacterium]
MTPVELETRRLTLTQLDAADEPALLALYADPRVMEHIEPGGRPRARMLDFLARMHKQWAELGFGFFSVRARGAADIIGSAGLLVREPGRPVELGYLLAEPAWGKGYATELCAELLRWGFAEHRPERIIADVLPANEASLRVLRKLGFTRDGDGEHGTHRYSVDPQRFRR